MKINKSALPVIIALLGASAAWAEPSQKALLAEAKVTQPEAAKIALGHVPDGKVKTTELEREHGKLIWSFDITTPNTKDITEVQVDAKTGKIVATEHETPAQQATEAAEDAGKK